MSLGRGGFFVTFFNPGPVDGRDDASRSKSRATACFNPRAREGRDMLSAMCASLRRVSIHAPVKGATVGLGLELVVVGVSIHAPVKGATSYLDGVIEAEQFQSTRP